MPRQVSPRVAISGLGVIAPGAIGAASFCDLVHSAQSQATESGRFPTGSLRSHRVALVRDFSAKDYIPVMKMRRMNNLSRMGAAAAKLAIGDGGLVAAGLARPEIGVAMGTAFGPVQTSIEYLREYLAKGAALAPPQLFAESVANAPGSHIAIEHGFEGFNVTFTQRESSALTALMFACGQIVKGAAKAALSGGVDEMNEVLFAVLDRVGVLAHAGEDRVEAARPFDRRRNGLVVGEGAAAFVLERPDALRAEPWGFASGFGIAKDETASISDWGSDHRAVVRAMRAALEDAEISAGDIDAIWASANGSVRGDRFEAHAIGELFGDGCPAVVATKGIFGEYAAGGGLHLASALVAMRDQFLPASCGFEELEEGFGIPVTREGRSAEIRNILVNSLSAGGGILCAVISRSANG